MKVLDMHCDTISALLKKRRTGECASLRDNDCHVSISRMQEGDYLLQNFALFVNLKKCTDPWQEVQELIKFYNQEILNNRDLIVPVQSFNDIMNNKENNSISAMLTVEEGGVCGGELERLDILYKQGVRMLTLTWNYENELGFPNQIACNLLETKKGLTEKGISFIQHMEELGMIVDVSHLSDAGFYDCLACSTKPFVASHSNAREICAHVRNLTDDMIRKLSDRGGVIGLNFHTDFLTKSSANRDNSNVLQAIVNHARHITEIGGMECLGLGSDFDGIDTNPELPGAHAMGKLWYALKAAGYTEGQLDKIFFGNVLRLYSDILET